MKVASEPPGFDGFVKGSFQNIEYEIFMSNFLNTYLMKVHFLGNL